MVTDLVMDREEIKKILPHREPMLLLDEAEVTGEGTAVGRYNVRGDEWFLQGHFPGNPVVPGVIQCEILAQACCVLFSEEIKGHTPVYTGLDNVRFKGMVRPGDTLEVHSEVVKVRKPFYFTKCRGFVNGKLVVKADLSFAST